MNKFSLLLLLLAGLACQTTDRFASYLAPAPEPTATRERPPTRAPEPLAPPTTVPVAIIPTPTPIVLDGSANNNANVRSMPSTGAPIVARLSKGDAFKILGRTAAADWYFVTLANNPNARGWINAPLVQASGVERLPVIDPGNVPPPYPSR